MHKCDRMSLTTMVSFSLITSLFLILPGCQSSAPKTGQNLTPPGQTKYEIEPVTSQGENYGAHFSSDGQKIIFISRDRMKHTHPQAYEMNLKTKKERRITFQDGEIFDVVYAKNPNFIYYSSSTDELKENPPYISQVLNPQRTLQTQSLSHPFGGTFPPTEIYFSSIKGRDIERLTSEKNFDGLMALGRHDTELFFSSIRKGHLGLYSLHLKSNRVAPFISSQFHDYGIQVSPDKKRVLWARSSEDGSSTALWISLADGSQAKALFSGAKLHHLEPAWHPNGQDILFVSNRDDSTNFEIYTAKSDGSSLRRLTYNSALDRQPDLSPDGRLLLFTSARTGSLQIHLQKIPEGFW